MSLDMMHYDSIEREFSRRRSRGLKLTESRRAEVHNAHPDIRAIDEAISSVSVEEATSRLFNNKDTESGDFHRRIDELSKARAELLVKYGYGADYLDPVYQCPRCKDTGFYRGARCSCYNRALAELLYNDSGLSKVLDSENFDTLSFRYHSPGFIDSTTGKSAREFYEQAVTTSKAFVDKFGESYNNLLFYGKTGTGKTFLTNCIAKALMDRGYSVIYAGAHDFFRKLADERFSSEKSGPFTRVIRECDLLIIDDLGSEMTNSFVSSELFALLNERNLKQRSIIISTNLEFGKIASVYSERTFSRILNNFVLIKLVGDDIRVQKQYDTTSKEII